MKNGRQAVSCYAVDLYSIRRVTEAMGFRAEKESMPQ
jgi:hypothetical protein